MQLPSFEKEYAQIKLLGIDEIYCVSVNDSYVMNAWANQMKIDKVKLIPDGSGNFTRFMGMFVGKNHLGLVIEVGDIWQLLMTELLKNGKNQYQ